MITSEIKKDFEFIKNEVKGVLLFGSAAKGELSKRSDLNIALVGPRNMRVLFRVFERVGGKYDVKIFEDLPLKLFRKKFYQKPVSLVKLFFLRKSFS